MSDLFTAPDTHDPGGKTRLKIPAGWKVGAQFGGPYNQYRYKLMHRWADGPMAAWLMMNPSVGDMHVMDPTIAKTARISMRLGYSGQYILNVCGYRATDNKRLLAIDDPVGPFNRDAILLTAERSAIIIVAHGLLPRGLQHHADAAVDALLSRGHTLYVLRLSKHGVPGHPLYIPESTVPQAWRGQALEAAA